MAQYIETRKEVIEAIHKAITEKWNLICMGCSLFESDCALCDLFYDENCNSCPLGKDDNYCNNRKSVYKKWSTVATDIECDECAIEGVCSEYSGCPVECSTHTANQAEAMLEALVQLLPVSEKERYGG